jgi:hypothetical protein
MNQHPLSESLMRKEAGAAAAATAAVLLSLLIFLYGGTSIYGAAAAGVAFILVLAAAGYMYWYINSYISSVPGKIIMTLLVLLISLAGSFVSLLACGINEPELFMNIIPLSFVYGLFCWIILLQWYSQVVKKNQMQEVEQDLKESITPSPEDESISRISVKEGTQIHIVHIDELLYIQSYGDYVLLITDSGKYIKEQTMKYFETHLPVSFVRIHRSYIVNSEKIARVELFGKESYKVYLKNNTTLRASTTGYKVLKEKLYL